jgi:hypothetical protein
MKYLRVTITNDEADDKGPVAVRVKDAKGVMGPPTIIDEGAENEFEFEEKGSLIISAT